MEEDADDDDDDDDDDEEEDDDDDDDDYDDDDEEEEDDDEDDDELDTARLLFILSTINWVNKTRSKKEIIKTLCHSVNHTRLPKEDHLPDWACRDNRVIQGDRVDHARADILWRLLITAHYQYHNQVKEILRKCGTATRYYLSFYEIYLFHILRVECLERHPASGLALCQNGLEVGVVLSSLAARYSFRNRLQNEITNRPKDVVLSF